MTQAYNLSQLANNLNSSGQLDAQDGLVNAVPIANGGTGASNQATARGNLDVPSTSGSGATGTWNIAINGNATTATNAANATTAATVSTTVSSTATGTTQSNGDNSARLATTAYVQNMSLGWGQTWQDVTASRVFNTNYTNSTGKAIMVCVVVVSAGGGYDPTWVIGGVTIGRFGATTNNGVYNMTTVIVPPALTYNLTATSASLANWYELR